MNEKKRVISVEEFKARATREVDIQGFTNGEEPITIRIRSLSLMKLVGNGKIPNELMTTAIELFEGKKKSEAVSTAEIMGSNGKLKDMASLIDVICDNAMVEPTFDEIGDLLTDEQKLEIFQHTQGGTKALNSFRQEPTN